MTASELFLDSSAISQQWLSPRNAGRQKLPIAPPFSSFPLLVPSFLPARVTADLNVVYSYPPDMACTVLRHVTSSHSAWSPSINLMLERRNKNKKSICLSRLIPLPWSKVMGSFVQLSPPFPFGTLSCCCYFAQINDGHMDRITLLSFPIVPSSPSLPGASVVSS
jgi:hypothetical protein